MGKKYNALPVPSKANLVVLDVVEQNATSKGFFIIHHNGGLDDVMAKANCLVAEMFKLFPQASLLFSRIGAYDQNGKPKWEILPDCMTAKEL